MGKEELVSHKTLKPQEKFHFSFFSFCCVKRLYDISDDNELILHGSDDEDIHIIDNSSNDASYTHVYSKAAAPVTTVDNSQSADALAQDPMVISVLSSDESDTDVVHECTNEIDNTASASSVVILSKKSANLKFASRKKFPPKQRCKSKNTEGFSYYQDFRLFCENDPGILNESIQQEYSKQFATFVFEIELYIRLFICHLRTFKFAVMIRFRLDIGQM